MNNKACVIAADTAAMAMDEEAGPGVSQRLIGALRHAQASYLVEQEGQLLALFDEPRRALRAAELLRKSLLRMRAPRLALSIGDEVPTETRASDPQDRMLVLHEGRSWLLSEVAPQVLIGRGEGCDVRLTDPHSSRHHARIELRQGRCMLIDCSQNGTLLKYAGGRHLLVASEIELPEAGLLYFSRPGGDVFRADTVQFQRQR